MLAGSYPDHPGLTGWKGLLGVVRSRINGESRIYRGVGVIRYGMSRIHLRIRRCVQGKVRIGVRITVRIGVGRIRFWSVWLDSVWFGTGSTEYPGNTEDKEWFGEEYPGSTK